MAQAIPGLLPRQPPKPGSCATQAPQPLPPPQVVARQPKHHQVLFLPGSDIAAVPSCCVPTNIACLTGGRPFKPRRDGTWTSDVPITRTELHRRRTEFWETAPQYDGLAETWNSLRVAVELSHQNDLPTAQAVLDSAGITIPTGDLGNGCYDELGHRFVIPEFVLSEPSNIQDDDIIAKPRDSSSTAVMKREVETESVSEEETTYTVHLLKTS
jgi:Ubiquitin-binding domain